MAGGKHCATLEGCAVVRRARALPMKIDEGARDLCLHLGAKLCVKDTWGSDIVTSAALHLAAATPRQALLNVCDLSGYVSPRLDPSGPARDGGRIRPGEAPGHGIVPDADVLGEPLLVLD